MKLLRLNFSLGVGLLLCFEAWGQPGPIALRSIDAWASSFTPPSIGGMAYWWSSLSLNTNISVSSWTDSVSGLVFYQGVSGRQPTNSMLGIGFQSGKILTNNTGTTALSNTNSSWVIVFYSASSANFQDVMVNGSAESAWVYANAGDGKLGWRNGFDSFQPISLNRLVDFYCTPVAPLGTKTVKTWTNGIVAFASQGSGNPNPSITLVEMGNDNSFLANDYLRGYIAEIMVWTNYIFTATDVSNLHNWITNRYGTNIVGSSGVTP